MKKANKQLCLMKGKGIALKMNREKHLCVRLPASLLHTMPHLCLGLAFQPVGGSLAKETLRARWFGV